LYSAGVDECAGVFAQAVVDARGRWVVHVGVGDGDGEQRADYIAVTFDPALAGVPALRERLLGACAAHRQCGESAVFQMDAFAICPPVARHSSASAASSLPGVKAATPRPQRSVQVRMSTPSVTRFGPCTETMAWAVWRA
jgi:hypothetical protein